jgi:hypothetical protein
MRRVSRVWVGRAFVALLIAAGTNAVLSALSVDHDAALIALLAAATVATVVLALAALDSTIRPSWTVRRRDAQPEKGEDTRTAMYRHVIEAHLTSQEGDEAIVWQVADLAKLRLRQVHGVRLEESPERATELLGPALADWMSHDRRHRYVPGARHRRYTLTQLGNAVRRIEEL